MPLMSDFADPTTAAEEALGASLADDLPETPTSTPEAENEALAWKQRLVPAIAGLAAYLERFDPCWETKPEEAESLAEAWAPVAAEATGGAEVPPLYVAVGLTALWALPRAVTTIRNRREASESEPVPRRSGEWEDDPHEGGADPFDGAASPLGS